MLPTHIRRVAWGTLLLQLFVPLSVSFSPAIAAMKASKADTIVSYSSTEPYVLGSDETVAMVAKKYGITVDELKKINIYRTFSRPFTALTMGDEIDIPRKASPFSVDNNKDNRLSVENTLAGHAVAGATALSNGDVAKSGERMVRSAASNEFNNSAQQWLSQFGTARVQLNINDDFHLDGSAADVLIPLYDNEKSILFTQLGARNKDSRNTVNMGAGVRTFQGNWMYGANTFFDNDLTGKNRRIGVGAEAWTDYLKLSANNYFGITDWHQSRDFIDYNERPANGYDLRAEAYLPSYPQLGGKAMYEKYRGDDVALFGKDNRQKNPHAITAGVNYTPIPLVTIGAEHRAGKGGQNDSNINFQLNYRLGETWQSHIDPSAVAASRTLAGSRYDLVERNNHIVLDYQKQNLVRLSLPDSLAGDPFSQLFVTAQVTATHGLERIDWQSAELMAAGGVLKQTSKNGLEITLPEYQMNRTGGNSYILSAIAYDTQGNASSQASMLITVNAQKINIANSTLVAAPVNIEANNSDTSVVTLTLRDSNNNPVTGQTIAFTSTLGTLGSVTEQANGVYTATLTAGTVSGVASLTVSVNGTALGVTGNITLAPGALDAARSILAVNKPSINADDRTGSTITFTAQDVQGNTITGLDIVFTTDLENSQIMTVVDHNDGTYTANINGTQTGIANIAVQSSGTTVSGLAVTTVTVTPGGWNATQTTPVMTVVQQTTDCRLLSGVYKRNYVGIITHELYDNYGNEIAGILTYNLGAATGTTVTSESINVDSSNGLTRNSNATVGNFSLFLDAYASEAACYAQRFVNTNVTITVTAITDDFKTSTVNKTFILGTGSN
ncbi:YrIlm family inverse autotransporter adhesin [Yersinia wautersii]|uniref:YrIlm family inverse autotransporter adhesin n=1 Tax=Yersinia wautersii TaxID=1341643 RepID=UPI0028C399AA|nr:YrIlm family inverse autotransporter adhesin [Yersinia wautersii]